MTDGQEVARRRLRLNMTAEQFADEADVKRQTLADFETGRRQPRDLTVAKILRALERLEDEAGLNAPPRHVDEPDLPKLLEIRAEGVYGIESIVVNGPVEDADEIRRQVVALIREIKGDGK